MLEAKSKFAAYYVDADFNTNTVLCKLVRTVVEITQLFATLKFYSKKTCQWYKI